jgi:hypothetical protein
VNDLSVLDPEAELLLLTLLEVRDVRALQLQRDLECINCKPVCKVLIISVSILDIAARGSLTPIAWMFTWYPSAAQFCVRAERTVALTSKEPVEVSLSLYGSIIALPQLPSAPSEFGQLIATE